MEKLIFKRVYEFLEKYNCLYNLQFGFRSKHSTIHALINITECVRLALDEGKYACGIFVDLQKAFDTVNHKILLDKLSHYGIRGNMNEWFKSYLQGRNQIVSINGVESELREILKVHDQITLLNCLFIHDFLNGKLPKSFDSAFLKLSNVRSNENMVNTINSDLRCLFLPNVFTPTYGLNSLFRKSIISWNTYVRLFNKEDIVSISKNGLKTKLKNTCNPCINVFMLNSNYYYYLLLLLLFIIYINFI